MYLTARLKAAMTLGGLSVTELTVRAWRAINDHEIQTRAAAVSFYAMLALVPFLGLVLTLAVQLLPDLTGSADPAKGIGNLTVEEFRSTLERALPKEASDEIESQISRLQSEPPVGLISIGLIITIWLSSSLYVAVIDAINRINGVSERRGFFHLRLIAIFMTVVEAVILVGSLLVIVGWNWILDWLKLGNSAAILATIALYLTVLVMVLLSFALTFYLAPTPTRDGNGSRQGASWEPCCSSRRPTGSGSTSRILPIITGPTARSAE
jgi:membrane protein